MFYLLILVCPYLCNILLFIYRIILPFLLSFVISFILYPIIRNLQKAGINKFLSIAIVFIAIMGIFALIIIMLIPVVVQEMALLKEKLPDIINNVQGFLQKYNINVDYENFDQNKLLLSTLNTTYNIVYMLFFVPVLTFYVLYDYEKIKKGLYHIAGNKYKELLDDIVKNLRAYFKGLILVTTILIIVSTIFFMIIKLDFALLFGILIGLTNIIPYIGPYIGGALTCIYALNTSITLVIIILVFISAIQILESNFLTPYIQSKFMKIHPLLVILSFLIFSKLFGFVGMLISLPLLSIIILVFKHLFLKNKEQMAY